MALVPLLYAVRSIGVRRAFVLGWIAGAVFYAVAWRWVLPTIGRLQEISPLAAAPFFAAFVAYHALQLGVFAALSSRRIANRSALPVAAIAAAWVIVEWCFPRVIPWYLGDALGPAPLLRQAADLGGAYLLSFAIAFANASLAAALVPQQRTVRLRFAAFALGTVGLLAAYGWSKVAPCASSPTASTAIPAVIVQGAMPSRADQVEAHNAAALRVYEELTRAAVSGATKAPLIVWPETTLRLFLRYRSDYVAPLNRLADDIGGALLVGALDVDLPSERELNSTYLFSSHAEIGEPVDMKVYHKRRLLPFGETLPMKLPWRTTGNFMVPTESPGSTLEVRAGAARAISFAPSICFEAIFAGAFNTAVILGASFLVNVNDDAWFGDTDEPYQHLNATILRAVETRRWLVRASNSGISAFVSPTGDIVASLPLGERGVLAHSIHPSDGKTLYVRFGDWPVALSWLIMAAGFSKGFRRRTS